MERSQIELKAILHTRTMMGWGLIKQKKGPYFVLSVPETHLFATQETKWIKLEVGEVKYLIPSYAFMDDPKEVQRLFIGGPFDSLQVMCSEGVTRVPCKCGTVYLLRKYKGQDIFVPKGMSEETVTFKLHMWMELKK